MMTIKDLFEKIRFLTSKDSKAILIKDKTGNLRVMVSDIASNKLIKENNFYGLYDSRISDEDLLSDLDYIFTTAL